MGTDFQGTNPAVIPANNWLGSVVSITGQISTGNCPCGYQSGFALFPDGTVYYVPQTWGVDSMGNPFQISFAEANVGTTSSISLEGIIRYDSSISSVRFTGFAYNSQRQVDYNSPSIYNIYSINTGDTNFYYGNDVVGSLTIKNFPVCS